MDDDDFDEMPDAAEAGGENELETVPQDAAECGACAGRGWNRKDKYSAAVFCPRCGGAGFLGVPIGATTARPGSRWKIAVLAARYAHGKALWHPGDRATHGPGDLS